MGHGHLVADHRLSRRRMVRAGSSVVSNVAVAQQTTGSGPGDRPSRQSPAPSLTAATGSATGGTSAATLTTTSTVTSRTAFVTHVVHQRACSAWLQQGQPERVWRCNLPATAFLPSGNSGPAFPGMIRNGLDRPSSATPSGYSTAPATPSSRRRAHCQY